MRYVYNYLLSKFWYTAQIFPAPSTYIQQITRAVTWYIWKGAIFKVPESTLIKTKLNGRMGTIRHRSEMQSSLPLPRAPPEHTSRNCYSSVAPNLGPHWTACKPPKRHEVSQESCAHLPLYNRDGLHTTAEKGVIQRFCRRLYHTQHATAMAAKEPREFRIMLLHPFNDWPKVWHKLHTAPITEEMKSVWFTVI